MSLYQHCFPYTKSIKFYMWGIYLLSIRKVFSLSVHIVWKTRWNGLPVWFLCFFPDFLCLACLPSATLLEPALLHLVSPIDLHIVKKHCPYQQFCLQYRRWCLIASVSCSRTCHLLFISYFLVKSGGKLVFCIIFQGQVLLRPSLLNEDLITWLTHKESSFTACPGCRICIQHSSLQYIELVTRKSLQFIKQYICPFNLPIKGISFVESIL